MKEKYDAESLASKGFNYVQVTVSELHFLFKLFCMTGFRAISVLFSMKPYDSIEFFDILNNSVICVFSFAAVDSMTTETTRIVDT